MSIRKIFDMSYPEQHAVMAVEGQILEILDEPPMGFEYRLKKLNGAMNSPWALSIAKIEKKPGE